MLNYKYEYIKGIIYENCQNYENAANSLRSVHAWTYGIIWFNESLESTLPQQRNI